MMFIPLKWTLKRHIYGLIVDHMNSGSTVSTPYGNQSIYCPYGVPIVDPEFIWSTISPYMCLFRVHFNGMNIISTMWELRL